MKNLAAADFRLIHVILLRHTPRLRFFTWSAIYSDVRQPRAVMLRVGFLSALLTNGAASVTNRFLQSQAWLYWLSTEVLGLSPMRAAPTSWMICPPLEMPHCSASLDLYNTLPPAAVMISWNVSCICLACRISSWLHLKWKRSTGMPHWSTVSGSMSQ